MNSAASLTQDDITRANVLYHEKLAATYDERIELYHPKVTEYFARLLDRHLLSRIADLGNARILDLGCGTGYLEHFLAPRCRNVTAVDVTPGMLAVARRKHPTVAFVEHDVVSFPIEHASYDVIAENALLHHIKDYDAVLDRMMAGVKPGGFVLLGYEPNESAFRLLGPVRSLYRKLFQEKRVAKVNQDLDSDELEAAAEYHQFYGYGLSPARIEARLRESGFGEVELFYPAISLLAQLYDRTGIPLVGLAPLVRLGRLTPNFHLIARKTGPERERA